MRIVRGGDEEYVLSLIRQATVLAVDVETINTLDYTCIGIGVYVSPTVGAYFRTFPEFDGFTEELMGILGDKRRTKIYFNGANFDLIVLDQLAYDEGLTKPDDKGFEDSEIMAKVTGLPGGLQRIGEEWLHRDDLFSIKSLFDEHNCSNMLGVPFERTAEKCLNDCRTTWEIWEYVNARITPRQRDCYETDRDLIPLLRKIERKGLGLRQDILLKKREELKVDVDKIARECSNELGFNVGSPYECGYVLASRGNHLPLTKSKRQLRTDNEILEELDDPLAATILDYRGKAKLLSTYIEPWIGKPRAYTHFRLDLATGRLGSGRYNAWDTRNRNLQNVPPPIRVVFNPDTGTWTWADHGQIELRVLAWVSKDERMMSEYAGSNPDLHSLTAERAGVSRDAGKTGNFSMVYGALDKVISKRAKIPLGKVPDIRGAFRELYPGAQGWIDNQFYNHNGEWVEDDFGRRMRLPEMQEGGSYNVHAFRGHVGKCAINYPIQGTAATIVKRGMLMIDSWGMDMRLQVHDEYVLDGNYEFPEELAHIHPELHTPFSPGKGFVWAK